MSKFVKRLVKFSAKVRILAPGIGRGAAQRGWVTPSGSSHAAPGLLSFRVAEVSLSFLFPDASEVASDVLLYIKDRCLSIIYMAYMSLNIVAISFCNALI